ncbi:M42 family metallopeptidase [Clostridium botulinum]|uniref:Endoglucanase, aminopeptidase M42 family n=1 Tax=Clostridium botulinum D str. 1873 TaxID=592027 RepID=A0A9P2G8Q0_CLOBO|nr:MULTISPECIES: peptidase M42 [Clostridium]EES92060.1 endoglucanase, aminopeptidase M42 family [Clostridium botulinum D str. 1873]MBO3442067.1 peptidase M42 [Clostridium haemolyticum]NFV48425.1 M42 family metallopeptidase [Clostridium botulinum]QPW55549.1 peptidase M42 [Clostridium botulinum]
MDRLMESLIDSFGVSTKEENIKDIIKKQIKLMNKEKLLNLDFNEDEMGNIVVKVGEGTEKLMICTHMDNTGLMVMDIDHRGFLKVIPVGNIDLKNISASFFKSQQGYIGRMGFLKEDSSKDNLFIDFGISTKEKVKEKIKEGDFLELIGKKIQVENKIIGANIHSRIACYIILKVIENISIKNLNKEVYFVFSVQKELGFKGVKLAAVNIKPHSAIVLDSMESNDAKEGSYKIALDKGTIMSVFDRSLVIHNEIKEKIEKVSKKLDLKLQYSISDGENEGGLIHKEVGGIKTGMIALPCRYINTSGEMISLEDVANTISLLNEFIHEGSIEN